MKITLALIGKNASRHFDSAALPSPGRRHSSNTPREILALLPTRGAALLRHPAARSRPRASAPGPAPRPHPACLQHSPASRAVTTAPCSLTSNSEKLCGYRHWEHAPRRHLRRPGFATAPAEALTPSGKRARGRNSPALPQRSLWHGGGRARPHENLCPRGGTGREMPPPPARETSPAAASRGRRWETQASRGDTTGWDEGWRDPPHPGKLRRGFPRTSTALPPAGPSADDPGLSNCRTQIYGGGGICPRSLG